MAFQSRVHNRRVIGQELEPVLSTHLAQELVNLFRGEPVRQSLIVRFLPHSRTFVLETVILHETRRVLLRYLPRRVVGDIPLRANNVPVSVNPVPGWVHGVTQRRVTHQISHEIHFISHRICLRSLPFRCQSLPIDAAQIGCITNSG